MASRTTIHTQRASDGTVVVEVRGEVGVSSSDRLRSVLVDAVTQLRPVQLVVDLLHVTFTDSTGIGALAAGHNIAPIRRGPIRPAQPEPVRDVPGPSDRSRTRIDVRLLTW